MREHMRTAKTPHFHGFINSGWRRDTKNGQNSLKDWPRANSHPFMNLDVPSRLTDWYINIKKGMSSFYIMCILSLCFCRLHYCLASTALLIFCLSSNSASLCSIKPVLSYTSASWYTGFRDYKVVTVLMTKT